MLACDGESGGEFDVRDSRVLFWIYLFSFF